MWEGGLSRVLTRIHTAAGQPRLESREQASWRRVLPVALLGLLISALFIGDRVGLPDEVDPTAPFVVGTSRGLDDELRERGVALADRDQLSQTGYDGQWYLIQSVDPLLRTDLPTRFDAPRYRAVRMLYPTAGWLLAAGQPPATPYALLVLGILAYALGCACCGRIASAYGRSPWWGLLFAAVPGIHIGLAFGTAEPLALALAVLGISLVLDRRYAWAGLAFAGAALTKETYLAFAAVTVVFLAIDGRARGVAHARWLRAAAAVTLPGAASLFAWWVYVERTLPWVPNPHDALGRFSPPFVGWWEVLETIARDEYPAGRTLGIPAELIMIASLVVLVAAVAVALWLRQSLMAYQGFAWAMFGLIIAGFLLERYGSANRTLAPAVLAAGLFLVTARYTRRQAAPATGAQAPAALPPRGPNSG